MAIGIGLLHRKAVAFRETVSQAGWTVTLLYAMDRVLRAVKVGRTHSYIIVCQPLVEDPAYRTVATRIECRKLRDVDYMQLRDDLSVIAYRKSQGGIPIGAFLEGKLMGVLWYTSRAFAEDEVRAIFDPLPTGRIAWDFGVEVYPEYRLGRAFYVLWRYAINEMRAKGLKYSLSRINALNTASVRTHKSLGGLVVGRVNFVCLGSMQLSWSSFAPRFHVAIPSTNPPHYKIDVRALGSNG
jgi:hypothetical protein